ncbi:peptidoglycan-binding protein [Draconibacterium sp.]|nr:peptidoglycan-binding protein [Draconibacterium sp.]
MKKSLLILTIVLVAVLGWLLAFPEKNPFKGLLQKKSITPANPLAPNAAQPIPTGETTHPSVFHPPLISTPDKPGFPLTMGSRGQYVKELQAGLNMNYGSALDVDGIFGIKTYRAVSSHGFNADAVSYSDYLTIIS